MIYYSQDNGTGTSGLPASSFWEQAVLEGEESEAAAESAGRDGGRGANLQCLGGKGRARCA
jgi:hypothetical protein